MALPIYDGQDEYKAAVHDLVGRLGLTHGPGGDMRRHIADFEAGLDACLDAHARAHPGIAFHAFPRPQRRALWIFFTLGCTRSFSGLPKLTGGYRSSEWRHCKGADELAHKPYLTTHIPRSGRSQVQYNQLTGFNRSTVVTPKKKKYATRDTTGKEKMPADKRPFACNKLKRSVGWDSTLEFSAGALRASIAEHRRHIEVVNNQQAYDNAESRHRTLYYDQLSHLRHALKTNPNAVDNGISLENDALRRQHVYKNIEALAHQKGTIARRTRHPRPPVPGPSRGHTQAGHANTDQAHDLLNALGAKYEYLRPYLPAAVANELRQRAVRRSQYSHNWDNMPRLSNNNNNMPRLPVSDENRRVFVRHESKRQHEALVIDARTKQANAAEAAELEHEIMAELERQKERSSSSNSASSHSTIGSKNTLGSNNNTQPKKAARPRPSKEQINARRQIERELGTKRKFSDYYNTNTNNNSDRTWNKQHRQPQ